MAKQGIEADTISKNSNGTSQIFTIQQDRSWTTVNIPREIFETFMETYSITPNFWKCVFTFGRKSEENEFEFPGFNCRKARAEKSGTALNYEFSYMLRRAELNGRSEEDGESPWSIRQTAVYHKLTCDDRSNVSGSTFLLVAPSDNFKSQFTDCLESSTADETETLSCWNTHRILCADSLRGWSDYMVWLQKKLKEQSNEIVLATVGNNKANLSPLTDFNINFEHRQELKIVEDQVLDLQVILPSLVDASHGIRAACARFAAESSTQGRDKFDLDSIIDEFEDYEEQANLLTERAKTLKANAESTAQLLSDLLSYEEAVALKDLASETQTESHFMCQMAEKSTKDAAAVKILTIITLVYLPTTIVANFFSTEFVKISDSNNMHVSTDVWLLAAISVPLTLITVVLWWAWVHFTKVEPTQSPENPRIVTLQLRNWIRSKRAEKSKSNDIKDGIGEKDAEKIDVEKTIIETTSTSAVTTTPPQASQPRTVEQSKVEEPDVAEPEVAEPEVAEPEVAEPEVAEPDAEEPQRLEAEDPREDQVPRSPVPKIQLRQATINQEVVGTTAHHPTAPPSPQSLATPERSRRDSAASNRTRSNSKASSTSGHWLRDQLHDARIECPQRKHCFFVPRSVQEDLINEVSVSQDIQSHNPEINEHDAAAYAKLACESARQLYATLAYIKKGADICSLLKEGITDNDLPFVRKPNARSKFALYRKDGQPIKASEAWKEKYLEKFDRSQWWMIAPVFHFAEDLYELDDNMFLPFVPFDTTKDELAHKQGGYSEVYPVRIHPAHHTFWPTVNKLEDEPLVAIKKLFSSDETEFKKEATILRAVGLKNHRHLIKLLATYKHEGKYHLMFPYANANLRKYWDDRPKPSFDRVTVLWSIRQMTGIANGLLRIHNFRVTYPLFATAGAGSLRVAKGVPLKVSHGEEWYGRHGDIKPENVLWFEKDQEHDPNGVLQIADFGLGRFHGRDSRSGLNPDTIQSSPTYEPPECQLRQPVSRAYDIWSLGCLYLEFVTWLLRGSQDIEGFSEYRGREATATGINDDNFFTIVNDGYASHAIVREEVVAWKNQLHAHERCSDLIHELLEVIMKDLLVTDTKKRCQAGWLFQQLNSILKKAEKDEAYMLKPNPHPAKPANDRSNSTPAVLAVPMTRVKRNSVTYAENTKRAKGHPVAIHKSGSIDRHGQGQ
ncbi:hypothetical protein IFR04_004751 [Cadophora malorum]|uniref:Protein kinase domain-containing protein n=1 Tax=Cadophora malorum TaxID=108018 RepID=A0A8H8BS27_9HELO|nr:hypothetical protein IFR04_004751 [Cadophora malorum]